MNEVLSPLTEDELTILMIAMRGESMMPIGRWEDTVLGLARRGFLEKRDTFNYFITDAGREACKGAEAEDDRALEQQVLERAGAAQQARDLISDQIDTMAGMLADLMRSAAKGHPESPGYLALQWGDELTRRAVEKLS